jgi:hypothetical protein
MSKALRLLVITSRSRLMKLNLQGCLVWSALGAGFCTLVGELPAASMKISIGIRENDTAGPIFDDGGGSGNGIEWVNRDSQTLTADGTWQLFTFTPASDPLLPFAGITADAMLEPGHEYAVLEHVRILNDMGIIKPIRLWIDDVTNTSLAAGAVVQDFEAALLGTEVMFQEPNFSGSTASNLVPGGTTLVADSMANSGSQSLQANFQFVDSTPTRWIRLTTFGTPNQPNPRVRIVEPGGPAPTISFYAKALAIPEPASFVLLMMFVALSGRGGRIRR